MEFHPSVILNTIRGFCKTLMERLMSEERSSYLKSHSETKANGFYKRRLSSLYGSVADLQVPRTRDGQFRSDLLPKGRSDHNLELLTKQLFRAGVSTRNIESILRDCFGTSLSHTTVSNLAKVAYEEVLKWRNRPLEKEYAALFIDAFFFPIKRETVENEAIYVALAITPEGHREVLGFWVPGGGEGASNWEEIFREIRSRGTHRIDFVVADGLKGIEQAISRVFPKAKYQYCVLHAARTTLNKVRASDKEKVSQNLKNIYLADTKEEAQKALEEFKSKWQKSYPKITFLWEAHFQSLTAFMELPSGLRRYIYTTNWVERLHKEIRRRIDAMEQFQNEESAIRILYLLYSEQNKRYKRTGTNAWRELYSRYRSESVREPKVVALEITL